MMKILLSIVLLVFSCSLHAKDPGKEQIGSLRVEIIFATNGKVEDAGARARELSAEDIKAIKAIKELEFTHYRSLGIETPKILRGYESWATPMRPSKEMLVSFEPLKREGRDKIQMVLEYWQSKRKLLRTNPVLVKGKPFYLLGPEWRGGRVILKVNLMELTE